MHLLTYDTQSYSAFVSLSLRLTKWLTYLQVLMQVSDAMVHVHKMPIPCSVVPHLSLRDTFRCQRLLPYESVLSLC